jgi:hypothetical protein
MSDWSAIDKLGSVGMEPDKTSVHKVPQSLDVGMNVRAIGPNLENAGGYSLVYEFPSIDAVSLTQFIPEEVLLNQTDFRLTQFIPEEVLQNKTDLRLTQFSVIEILESDEYTP